VDLTLDSKQARKLFHEHSTALAYVDVQKQNGDRSVGSAFHVGDGVFVTARHVVEHNLIVEVKIPEPVAVTSNEYFREVLRVDVTDEYVRDYDESIGKVVGSQPLHKHWLQPLEIEEGPFFPKNESLDVAVFKVKSLHAAAAVVRLGIHWDDWVYRRLWQLSDAIVLGFPPIPMVNEPVLVAARAEIHTFVVPRHSGSIHFILSAVPRGGFSGGVAIHEDGDALGVITSSLVYNQEPEQLGFFSVLSIEAIVQCLMAHDLFPRVQQEYHERVLGISRKTGRELNEFIKDAERG
jgi:hypothetical protein